MKGIKHTIKCHCILPQFRTSPNPPIHEFVVFSVLDDSDTVMPKSVHCNNCGVIHQVIDMCRSEIVTGREDCSLVTKKDVAFMLPSQVAEVLENYNCDLPTWEQSLFLFQERQWGNFVILERKENDTGTEGKLLKFHSYERFTIEPYIDRRDLP